MKAFYPHLPSFIQDDIIQSIKDEYIASTGNEDFEGLLEKAFRFLSHCSEFRNLIFKQEDDEYFVECLYDNKDKMTLITKRITDYANQYLYSRILYEHIKAGLLGEIHNYEGSEMQLNEVKQNMIREISTFFGIHGKSRFFMIRNCYEQPLLCNGTFAEGIDNEIGKAEKFTNNILPHFITKIDGDYSLNDENKLIKLFTSLETLKQIKTLVAIRRTYCAVALGWHNLMIKEVENIEDLIKHKELYSSDGIWSGVDGTDYIATITIKVDAKGNVVNQDEIDTFCNAMNSSMSKTD